MTWGQFKQRFKSRFVKDSDEIVGVAAFTDTEGRRWLTVMIEDRVEGITFVVRKPE